MEIISSEDLKDIFYSGFPTAVPWDCIDELYIALHNEVVVYHRYSVSSVKHYHKLSDAVTVAEGLGPQGHGHMALKEIAKEWLQTQHGVAADSEIYFAGLHPDVISKEREYVIECGTTDESVYSNFSERLSGSMGSKYSISFFGRHSPPAPYFFSRSQVCGMAARKNQCNAGCISEISSEMTTDVPR